MALAPTCSSLYFGSVAGSVSGHSLTASNRKTRSGSSYQHDSVDSEKEKLGLGIGGIGGGMGGIGDAGRSKDALAPEHTGGKRRKMKRTWYGKKVYVRDEDDEAMWNGEHPRRGPRCCMPREARANKAVDNDLPHITIQMPVYKESLESVLTPSILSLKKAMQTYARQGGTSTIFVNDDGLRVLPEADRDERIAFYANHGIGWVARPRHDDSPDGFKRAGRFKKASNMNYGLALSLKAEKYLEGLLEIEQQRRRRTRGARGVLLCLRAIRPPMPTPRL
ncbi:Glucans biosynthesis glucosyltransferase [Salix suchowensis]|nr:Glucans biosynthesis glucosyltransferase [Salix suchowensis]